MDFYHEQYKSLMLEHIQSIYTHVFQMLSSHDIFTIFLLHSASLIWSSWVSFSVGM